MAEVLSLGDGEPLKVGEVVTAMLGLPLPDGDTVTVWVMDGE